MVAPTRHEFFEVFQRVGTNLRFREWWKLQWETCIQFYAKLGWAMIPIGVRSKRPVAAFENYESRGPAGPYLKADDAKYWVWHDFNLAVVAGPSKIIWCDIDQASIFNNLPGREQLLRGLVMRTPRGYALPLQEGKGARQLDKLTVRGFDFRSDIMYELVPLSETCTWDHHLRGASHSGPREPCNTGQKHDYHIRTWITPLTNPILTISEFLEAVA